MISRCKSLPKIFFAALLATIAVVIISWITKSRPHRISEDQSNDQPLTDSEVAFPEDGNLGKLSLSQKWDEALKIFTIADHHHWDSDIIYQSWWRKQDVGRIKRALGFILDIRSSIRNEDFAPIGVFSLAFLQHVELTLFTALAAEHTARDRLRQERGLVENETWFYYQSEWLQNSWQNNMDSLLDALLVVLGDLLRGEITHLTATTFEKKHEFLHAQLKHIADIIQSTKYLSVKLTEEIPFRCRRLEENGSPVMILVMLGILKEIGSGVSKLKAQAQEAYYEDVLQQALMQAREKMGEEAFMILPPNQQWELIFMNMQQIFQVGATIHLKNMAAKRLKRKQDGLSAEEDIVKSDLEKLQTAIRIYEAALTAINNEGGLYCEHHQGLEGLRKYIENLKQNSEDQLNSLPDKTEANDN